MTKRMYVARNNYYYDTPVYHVWKDGKQIITTTSQDEAYYVWENNVKSKMCK